MGLPFHPLYLIALLGFLVVLAIPIAIVVVLVLAASRSRSGRTPYGLRSPDGRWWWDGRQWQPVPPPADGEA